jgi:hypothetical protein
MNYQRIYDQLIERAQNRLINGYKERHHIIPRCMDGTDEPENLVSLTAEEHFIAHQLLVKIYPENYKLVFAAAMMTKNAYGERVNNKLHGWLRKNLSKATSETLTGRKLSDETKQKMSLTRTGRVRGPHSEETKRKISLAHIGKKFSEETKIRMSVSAKNKKEIVPKAALEAANSPRAKIKAEATKKRNREFKKMAQFMDAIL